MQSMNVFLSISLLLNWFDLDKFHYQYVDARWQFPPISRRPHRNQCSFLAKFCVWGSDRSEFLQDGVYTKQNDNNLYQVWKMTIRSRYRTIDVCESCTMSWPPVMMPRLHLSSYRHSWVIGIWSTFLSYPHTKYASFVAILCAHENHISLALLQFLPNDSFYVLLVIVVFVVLFLSIFSVPTERYTCMCIYSSTARQCEHSFTEHNNFETQESLVVLQLLST